MKIRFRRQFDNIKPYEMEKMSYRHQADSQSIKSNRVDSKTHLNSVVECAAVVWSFRKVCENRAGTAMPPVRVWEVGLQFKYESDLSPSYFEKKSEEGQPFYMKSIILKSQARPEKHNVQIV